MLEWVGDVGGLFDGLRILSHALLLPVSAMALRQKLFSAVHSEQKHEKRSFDYLRVFVGCTRRDRLYRKQLRANQSAIVK